MTTDYTQKGTTMYIHRPEYDHIACLLGQLFSDQIRLAFLYAIRNYGINGGESELEIYNQVGFEGDDKRTTEEREKEHLGIFAAQVIFPLIKRLIDIDKDCLRQKGIIKEEEQL